MNLITTQKPPLNLFEVKRSELPYNEWISLYEVPAYKVPKSAIESERLIEIACIMTGVLITNPGTVANDDSDIEVSARFDVQKEFLEYGELPTSVTKPDGNDWEVGNDVVRVGQSLYVCTATTPTFEKFLDELAAPGSTYYIDTTNVNPPSYNDVDTAIAAPGLANKSTFVLTGDESVVYVKYQKDDDDYLGIPLRRRYTLVSNFIVSPSDFALISLERQVMKSGDRLQLRCETVDVTAIAHFSFILNQREEFTRIL